jgi:hypothetical protein
MSVLAALRSPDLNYLASPTPSWRPTSALQWLRLLVCSLTLLPLRLAGLALTFSAAAALYLGLVHNQAPWCV